MHGCKFRQFSSLDSANQGHHGVLPLSQAEPRSSLSGAHTATGAGATRSTRSTRSTRTRRGGAAGEGSAAGEGERCDGSRIEARRIQFLVMQMAELKFDDVMEMVFADCYFCQTCLKSQQFLEIAMTCETLPSANFLWTFAWWIYQRTSKPGVAQGNQSCATGEAGTVPWWLRLVHGPTDISSGSQRLEVHGKFLRVSLFGTDLIFSCFMASSNATPLR